MHLKYELSICPPVFAYLVEMCIFKISPLLRWIIDLKVCVKFHASLFFLINNKRVGVLCKVLCSQCITKGNWVQVTFGVTLLEEYYSPKCYYLNESFLLTSYVVDNRLLQVHAIQLTYNKCSYTFVVLWVYMCLIYMNIIITLSISVKCIFYQISKVFPHLSVREREWVVSNSNYSIICQL